MYGSIDIHIHAEDEVSCLSTGSASEGDDGGVSTSPSRPRGNHMEMEVSSKSLHKDSPTLATEATEDSWLQNHRNSFRFNSSSVGLAETDDILEEDLDALSLPESTDSEVEVAVRAAKFAGELAAASLLPPQARPPRKKETFLQERAGIFTRNIETITSKGFLQDRVDTFSKNMVTITTMLLPGISLDNKEADAGQTSKKASRSWRNLEEKAVKGAVVVSV